MKQNGCNIGLLLLCTIALAIIFILDEYYFSHGNHYSANEIYYLREADLSSIQIFLQQEVMEQLKPQKTTAGNIESALKERIQSLLREKFTCYSSGDQAKRLFEMEGHYMNPIDDEATCAAAFDNLTIELSKYAFFAMNKLQFASTDDKRTTPQQAEAISLRKEDKEAVVSQESEEFDGFQVASSLLSQVKNIVVAADIRHSTKYLCGIWVSENHNIYLNVNQGCDYRSTFHHEFGHVLYFKHHHLFPKRQWYKSHYQVSAQQVEEDANLDTPSVHLSNQSKSTSAEAFRVQEVSTDQFSAIVMDPSHVYEFELTHNPATQVASLEPVGQTQQRTSQCSLKHGSADEYFLPECLELGFIRPYARIALHEDISVLAQTLFAKSSSLFERLNKHNNTAIVKSKLSLLLQFYQSIQDHLRV